MHWPTPDPATTAPRYAPSAGRHTRDIQTVLGYNYGGTVVHRDDLVLP
jgi:glutamate 5-kinase